MFSKGFVRKDKTFSKLKPNSLHLKANKGFTLIELLVVIAIIGMLSSVVLASLNSARAKARDARRLADINQIQKAIDLYYDEYGHYPVSGSCNSSSPNTGWCNSVQSMQNGHWVRNRLPGSAGNLDEFLASDPTDPEQGDSPNWINNTYFYYAQSYGGTGQWYMLVFRLEDTSHPYQQQDGVTACNGQFFHYGNNSNGIITVGRNCATS